MKHIHCNDNDKGFYGDYWPCMKETKAAMIAMIGDDSSDYLARTAVKWLLKKNVNVLTVSIVRKNYSFHNFPLERIENAISFLKEMGNQKIGIVGASTTGTLALTASSLFSDISMTIALTPSDFIWQGFTQGKKDDAKEWPVPNESLFTYKGEILPYMPFYYQHPKYFQVMKEESKKNHDMINSVKIFEDSEKAHPIQEEEKIKVENIQGRLILVGAEDDALWNTAKYIRRMKERLENTKHESDPLYLVYEHGTHFVFPESMLKMFLPIGSSLFVRLCFHAAKNHKKKCRITREDIDRNLSCELSKWASKVQ